MTLSVSRLLLLGLLAGISACSAPTAKDYAGKTPELDARDYLNGDLEAWGAFQSRTEMAEPRFYIKLHGEFDRMEGTLHEDFTYDDGHTQQRVWHLQFSDDHHFTGTAPDVEGIAHGEQYGNSINMKYVLDVPHEGKTYALSVDDWLYRVDATHLVNHSHLTKYGFDAGDLLIAFNKKQ